MISRFITYRREEYWNFVEKRYRKSWEAYCVGRWDLVISFDASSNVLFCQAYKAFKVALLNKYSLFWENLLNQQFRRT